MTDLLFSPHTVCLDHGPQEQGERAKRKEQEATAGKNRVNTTNKHKKILSHDNNEGHLEQNVEPRGTYA